MSDFGLTPQGFKRKRYSDVIAAMETRARNLFGETVNLSAASPLGIILRIIAWSLALIWEMLEAVYNSAYADTATGNGLDRVAKNIGISRKQARRAVGVLEVSGTAGTTFPAGLLAQTPEGVRFETLHEATIDDTGQVRVNIRALQAGTSGNVAPGAITQIVTPYPGIDSVTNPEPTSGGQQRENDRELRHRYTQSVATAGASTLDSIRATLLQLPDVRAALVQENPTMNQVGALPPKCVACYVLGGADEEIGRAILRTKAAGIQAWGTTTVMVTDSAGQEHQIGFTRATEAPIVVSATLTVDSRFPTDGADQVRNELIRYIGGDGQDGQLYAGLGLGEMVVYTRLIASLYQVPGIVDADVTIARQGQPSGTSNIPIGIHEVAVTGWTLVTVTVGGATS